MGNANATVGVIDAPNPRDLLANVERKVKRAVANDEDVPPPLPPRRRSTSHLLARRNSSIRSSMRKNRQSMGFQPRRKFLLRRKPRQPPRNRQLTPDQKEFLAAAAKGDLEAILEGLRNGVQLQMADANEMTALHHAAKHARDDVVRSLLDRGADANATDLTGGFTPLHWVIINSCHPVGSTNHVDECIVALARGGCDLNATDFNLATPLHIAAQKGVKSTIDTLVRLGANPQAKDVMGRSCLEVAKNDEIRKFIKSLHNKKERVVYHVLEVPSTESNPLPPPPPPPLYHVLEVPPSSSRSPSPPLYHVLEVTPSNSRSPSPTSPTTPTPVPAKKPRLSANIPQSPPRDTAMFRNLPQFRRQDSPGYPAPPPPPSPACSNHSRHSTATPEYSIVNVPLPYKYRPLPLLPTEIPSPLYRYNSSISSPIPPPPHAFSRRRASRKHSSSNLSSTRPHRYH